MKKILFAIMLLVGAVGASAQINPVSQGTYKVEHIGGLSDIYVKLSYATDGSYYAFILKCADMYNPATFTVVLGHSPQEAMQSVDALLNVLDNGNKGEIYTIVLDHQPHDLALTDSLCADIQISGHTHRGQIWPFNLLTDKLYEQSYGYRKWSHSHIYVSSGLSLWGPPFRIGTRSEIVVMEIKLN